MTAGKVRFAGFVCSVLIAVLGLALHPGCRSRRPEDPEGALVKRRAELLARSRRLALAPGAFGGPMCPVPLLQIDGAGITVSLHPSNTILGQAEPPSPPPSRPRPSIWGQVVVPRAGICPSVPRRNGHLDGDALVPLLRALIASLPRCPPEPVPVPGESELLRMIRVLDAQAKPTPSVVIAPGDGITWQEIIEVIDTAAKADLKEFWLVEALHAASCAGAMTPEALREHLAAWRPEDED